MDLRDYQARVINDLYNAYAQGNKRMALIAATAAGKTVISTKLCLDASTAGKRSLFIVHLDKLVEQTAEKFTRYGLEVGFVKAGYEENPDTLVQIASIQTLNNRETWKNYTVDFIIFDEAHITLTSQVGKDIIYNIYPDARVVALTATPKRLGVEQIGDHLEGFVATPTPLDLQRMGFLSQMRYYVPSASVNVSDLQVKGDDYEVSEIKNRCFTPELISAIIKEWFLLKDTDGSFLCRGKRTLAFCVDIEHAECIAYHFNRLGVPFACLTSETPLKERAKIYNDFREGTLIGISSVNVISIGFDEPMAEVGLLLRPTASEALHLQQIGRLMRIAEGKRFGVILDQAGNTTRLGIPEDIQNYTLPTSKEKTAGVMPTKVCPQCDRIVPRFTVDCACGHHWITKFDIDDSGMIELPINKTIHVETLRDRFRIYRFEGFTTGVSPEHVEKRFAKEYGISPLDEWFLGSTVNRSEMLKKAYIQYLLDCANKENKSEDWALKQLELEFGSLNAA
jgi:superfamily II DNA or RNA helicase